MKLALVTSYSNLQLRLGYLKIVAAMGNRTPTTKEAFERKLAALFPAPPAKTSAFGTNIVAESDSYIDVLFKDLSTKRGHLNKNNLDEIVTLAKAFGFLHPTNCSLFEIAMVLRALMTTSGLNAIQDMDVSSRYNPLKIEAPMERAFFMVVALLTDLPSALMTCVAAENTTPFRLYEGFPERGEQLQEGKNACRTQERGGRRNSSESSLVPYTESNMLLKSYALVKAKARKQLIANWGDWINYFEGDEPQGAFAAKKYFRMGKRSSFRHHAAPRLEFLIDLGLLQYSTSPEENGREQDEDESNYCYEANEATNRFASFFRLYCLEQRELNPEKFIRERAIQCYGETFGLSLRNASEREQMEFLLMAYTAVKRDFGTTPMWTVALMGSLIALKAGARLEIASLYELARNKSKAPDAQVRLSGGSRFDGEFLIGITPALLKTASSNALN